MYSWNDKIKIKKGHGELQINSLMAHKVIKGQVVKYLVNFSVWSNSGRRTGLKRIATVSQNDENIYSFIFENETIEFVFRNKYVDV